MKTSRTFVMKLKIKLLKLVWKTSVSVEKKCWQWFVDHGLVLVLLGKEKK